MSGARVPRATGRGVASVRAWALALVVVLLVGGCAAIPTSGPIGTGDVVLSEPAQPFPVANDPPQDGSLQAVVQGFLLASAAGLADQFVVARKYLTTTASTRWDPTARLVVYPARTQLAVVPDEQAGTAVVSVQVQGSVDDSGVYSEAPPSAEEDLTFELVKGADGQWRISTLPDAVVMSSIFFAAFYRQAAVYFPSLDGSFLVPDLRWFPATGITNDAVRALLSGPSPWLRDVVQVVAPEGTRLGASGVTESTGEARVDLTSPASGADAGQRSLLVEQIAATLQHLPGSTITEATQVVVTASGGEPWVTPDPGIARDPQPESGPYVIADGRLEVLVDSGLVPVEGLAELPPQTSEPALSMDGQVVVALAAGQALVRFAFDGSPPTTLVSGSALISPTVDRFDWTWTADRAVPGRLIAVSPDGEVVPVEGDWLAGAGVVSVAVSRDGTRIAVAHTGSADARTVLDVATVLRDEEGRPQRLGETVQVGQSMTEVTQVEWMNESTLAVLGLSGTLVVPSVHLVPVGGQSAALSLVDGTRTIAAGRGDRALYLADEEGALFWRQGGAWVSVVDSGVVDPVFPG